MKVKELIDKLNEFDGELEVGGSGHFGELLEIYWVELKETFVAISVEYADNHPD